MGLDEVREGMYDGFTMAYSRIAGYYGCTP